MFILKGCQRCKGDLLHEKDQYGSFYRCMQCGRLTEVGTKQLGNQQPESVAAGELTVEKVAA